MLSSNKNDGSDDLDGQCKSGSIMSRDCWFVIYFFHWLQFDDNAFKVWDFKIKWQQMNKQKSKTITTKHLFCVFEEIYMIWM